MLRFLLPMLVVFVVGQAFAGSIGYKQIGRYMDWEPDCYKPSPPSFYVSDVDSFNMAVDEYNYYVNEVENYLACLQSEAESDISIIKKAILNGMDEKRSEIIADVESSKSDLEMQRSFLD